MVITARAILLTVLTIVTLTTGCITVEDNRRNGPSPSPGARSTIDGVETWNLTGEPTEALLGVERDLGAGIFESDEPRQVVLLLPEDIRVQTQAKVLDFDRAGDSRDPRFGFGLRGPTVAPDELVEQLRSVTEQLGVLSESAAALDEFVREVADAPPGQTERVRFSSASTTLGSLRLNVSANLAPIAGAGRLDISGTWERR